MGKEVIMPKLGLTMTKGRIIEWRKREGENVREGEVIAIIETEKLTAEIKAPISGVLLKIYYPPKSEVAVGQIIAYIGEPGEKPPEISERAAIVEKPMPAPEIKPIPTPTPTRVVRATPRARRLAEEKNIDLSTITGSGPGGLITEEDVLREIERREKYTSTGVRVRENIPLTPMRETIAKRMVESLQTMAQVTLGYEAVVDALVELREELLRSLEEKIGLRITYTDILVKIVAMLLREHPYLNAVLEEGRIRLLEDINIGVAVALDHGLIVPVVKNADKKKFEDIVREVHTLIEKARKGSLSVDEVSQGTFTITNLGMFDVDMFTPIINPPQSAILGVGSIRKKPVVVDNTIRVANTMWLSLTFDHRVMDGHIAAGFLQDLAKTLNDKEKMKKLLEI